MLGKLIAIWLVVLALSPFTAPFSTCDLAGSVNDRAPGSRPSAASPDDATLSQAVPLLRPPCRVRLVVSAELESHADRPAMSLGLSIESRRSSTGQAQQASLTILRI